jgi:hypothetical protein
MQQAPEFVYLYPVTIINALKSNANHETIFYFLPALVLALISTGAMAQGELKFETGKP